MRILFITLLSCMCSISQAQALKGDLSVNVGAHWSNFYGTNFYPGGATIHIFNQSGTVLMDMNVLYTVSNLHRKLKPIVGLGFHQKGFQSQEMRLELFNHIYEHEYIVSRSYLSIFAGAGWELVKRKNMTISVAQLLSPEIDVDADSDHWNIYNDFGLSTRTSLCLSWQTSSNMSVQFTPYFHTALTKYHDRKIREYFGDYRPYAIGVNLGAAWRF